MPRFKFALDKILNNKFLPLMKKALIGDIGGRRQNYYFFVYEKIFCPPPHSLVCCALGGLIFRYLEVLLVTFKSLL